MQTYLMICYDLIPNVFTITKSDEHHFNDSRFQLKVVLNITGDSVLLKVNGTPRLLLSDAIGIYKSELVEICSSCYLIVVSYYNCIPNLEKIQDCPCISHSNRMRLNKEDRDKLQMLYAEAESSYRNGPTEFFKDAFRNVLTSLTRRPERSETRPNGACSVLSSQLYNHFVSLVENHFQEYHTVKEYAQLLCRSPKTLANLFVNLGKSSPLAIIQQRLLVEASDLLGRPELSIKEISYLLGFKDVQTFSRFFKAKMTTTPSAYRSSRTYQSGISTPEKHLPYEIAG